jgi:hypothetical protein
MIVHLFGYSSSNLTDCILYSFRQHHLRFVYFLAPFLGVAGQQGENVQTDPKEDSS